MIWIPSFGSKYHIVTNATGFDWSLCGISLMKDPVENPPEDRKCKRCLKLYEASL